MSEPTFKQYKILKSVYDNGPLPIDRSVSGLDDRWELVRKGYLQSLIGLVSGDTTLQITVKGIDYIESQND